MVAAELPGTDEERAEAAAELVRALESLGARIEFAGKPERLPLEIAGGSELSWPLPAGPADVVERLELTWAAAPPPALPPRVAALRFEPAR